MKKKFLFLSTRDNEGGATAWFIELAQTLYNSGYEIAFCVKDKRTNLEFVKQVKKKQSLYSKYKKKIRGIIFRFFGQEKNIFFNTTPEYAFFPNELEFTTNELTKACEIERTINFIPDIIIQCLTYDFINTQTLLDLKKTWILSDIYLVAYDMSCFTAGCHVFWNCNKFESICVSCPGIDKNYSELIKENFIKKKENIEKGKFGVLYSTPFSKYNADRSLFFKNNKKKYIGMCIDTTLFNDRNRNIAKDIFAYNKDKKYFLVGSDNIKDKRKGVNIFFKALEELYLLEPKLKVNVEIIIVGHNNRYANSYNSDFNINYIDFITDNRLLSLLYQAADVFVSPSIEDAGPAMVAQALACGTPVVGFKTGILYDDTFFTNGKEGYVNEIGDFKGMAKSLFSICNISKDKYFQMNKDAVCLAQNFFSQAAFIDSIEKL